MGESTDTAAGEAALRTYCVRVEYHLVAFATEEVEATSPEEAIERARRLDREGQLVYDQEHETLQELTVYVSEDEASLRQLGEPLLVEKSRHERLADTGQHLVDMLRAVTGYARSRAEDLHEQAEESGDAADFARWLKADAAVTTVQRWIDHLGG